MIQGVIFDLGGTLMYFEGNWEEIDARSTMRLANYLRRQGIGVGDDFAARFRAMRERGWKLAEEKGIEARIEDALSETVKPNGGDYTRNGMLPEAISVYYEDVEQCWHGYPDAIETLRELRNHRLLVGLISNADSEKIVYDSVARLGFAPYLNPVLSSASEPRWRKPDPRIFHRVADVWKVKPNDIAMVGDSPRYDILGAHRAGMHAILINRGDNAPWQKIPDELANDPLIQPDATVGGLAEIPSVIQQF